ncbi:MAG: hypothetical protein V1863_01220 [Candidatus Omnitrophota bacterium]
MKNNSLSSPVGRRVSASAKLESELDVAGYVFLLGANRLLGISSLLASAIKKSHPGIRLKIDAIEAITEAWIMAKALYNIPLEKIEDYSKSELWTLLGRRISQGLLKEYIETIKMLQLVNNEMVMEISSKFEDINFFRITLANGTKYFLDGQLKSIWKDEKIPVNFYATYLMANSYKKNGFFGNGPIIVFAPRPEKMLGEEVLDFILSIDGAVASKRLRKIEGLAPSGKIVHEESFLIPERRRFIIGAWPWQHKSIQEVEKKPAPGRFVLEALGREYFCQEEPLKLSQPIHNEEVTIRQIVLKQGNQEPATIGILTNLEKNTWPTERVIRAYLERFSDIEQERDSVLDYIKNPSYLEDFVSAEKMRSEAKKLNEARDPEQLFSIIVEILHQFTKRAFFPPSCGGWGFLKMRELFYKQRGLVKRDFVNDVLFNLFCDNKLENFKYEKDAAMRFNGAKILDFSGKKIWVKISS